MPIREHTFRPRSHSPGPGPREFMNIAPFITRQSRKPSWRMVEDARWCIDVRVMGTFRIRGKQREADRAGGTVIYARNETQPNGTQFTVMSRLADGLLSVKPKLVGCFCITKHAHSLFLLVVLLMGRTVPVGTVQHGWFR